jgi:hypothetical protein
LAPNSKLTYKDMLFGVWERSKEQPLELKIHGIKPPTFEYLWSWLCELPHPVTWTEIRAWEAGAGFKVKRWEGRMLIQADNMRR